MNKKALAIVALAMGIGSQSAMAQYPELTPEGKAKIDSLNAKIAAYAAEQGFGYADFNAFLREGEALAPQYDSSDGVHPNREAYQVMESIVEAEIAKILQLRQ